MYVYLRFYFILFSFNKWQDIKLYVKTKNREMYVF